MCIVHKNFELAKTLTYFAVHITVGFTIAYLLTGSIAIAGGIALIEPAANGVAFFFHEKAWNWALARPASLAGAAGPGVAAD